MKQSRRFPKTVLKLICDNKSVYIRAGSAHRFIRIWGVVVGDRVFVRPWFDKSTGWRRTFMKEPHGAIRVAEREIRVLARKASGQRLWDAIDNAYAEKYNTDANRPWVRGLCTAKRRKRTTELLSSS